MQAEKRTLVRSKFKFTDRSKCIRITEKLMKMWVTEYPWRPWAPPLLLIAQEHARLCVLRSSQ